MTETSTRVDRAHAWIDAAYSALAHHDPEFVARTEQVQLSKDIAQAFIEGTPFVAEAPTGTGKTLAYLVGALAVQQSGLTGKDPVVVSTATKALQQQLFEKDLPRLVRAKLLARNEVAIVKGKGNYVCLRNAEEAVDTLERAAYDPDVFIEGDEVWLEPSDVRAMVDAYESGRWDGDFDTYEGKPVRTVRPIAVSTDSCTRRKCPHYSNCAYFNARRRLEGSRIVVANHDLVVRDLWLVHQGTEPTLPVENYLVVFDEAHHLPEKAIKVGEFDAPLSGLQAMLPRLAGLQRLLEVKAMTDMFSAYGVKPEHFERGPLGAALRELVDVLAGYDVDEQTCQRRFPRGEVPADVAQAIEKVLGPLGDILVSLMRLLGVILDKSAPSPGLEEKVAELQRRALDFKAPAEEASKCLRVLVSNRRFAKWFFRKDSTVSMHVCPLEGAQVLVPLLWESPRVKSVVMVSATLRDIDGFGRFTRRAGLPENTRFSTLPYRFPYQKSKLVVAPMVTTPKLAERRQFVAELSAKLPLAINPEEGTLVLFPSWTMLRELGPQLKLRFGERAVKLQGEAPVKQLVREHCEDIEAGDGSILAGVQTMAEGLDLPGKLCEHVIIVSLPFAVPTDPVEQEIAEQLGNRYFSERALPDAMTRLTQMAGRLLRRESDRGRITLFDRRLATTSYGKRMMTALPPYEKVIMPLPTGS